MFYVILFATITSAQLQGLRKLRVLKPSYVYATTLASTLVKLTQSLRQPRAQPIKSINKIPIAASIGLILLFASAFTQALSSNNIDVQRYHYELAKAALKKDDTKAFALHYGKLENYPLRPYLEYALTRKKLYPLKKSDIENFIQTHAGSYLGERMHRQYLHTLASRQSWSDLLYWYKDELANTELRCMWIEARVASEDSRALSEVAAIWLSDKSLPKKCDPLFALWKQSEFYTDNIIWQRYLLSLNNGNRSLARYLEKQLSQNYHTYTALLWELDAQPYRISRYKVFNKHTPEMQNVIAFGVAKHAKQNPLDALKHWHYYEATQIFRENIIGETKRELVNKLLRAGYIDEVRSLVANSPSLRKTKTIETLIRQFLKEERWQDAIETIALLPENDRNSDRWRYWNARLSELNNTQAETILVRETYQALAKNRSFYGFLSADILGQHYELQQETTQADSATLKYLESMPSIARAKELWLTKHLSEAYTEWFYGLSKLSSKELAAAGLLANQWGWYDRGIQAMIAGKHWNHLGVRFPLAYKQYVEDAAGKTSLDASFIFAIARQESAMSEVARSSAGARGLMQLMPSTAKETAYKRGISHRTEDLYNPDHNIELGSQYLDELLKKFNGNRILAAAAYNAGPHRVKRWTSIDANASNMGTLPYDVWIETIPFRETRGYVQNVLTYAVIYSMRMGSPEPLITKNEAKRKL